MAKKTVLIREVAQTVGMMVSNFPGVMFGQLYYRHVEKDKIKSLRESDGDFDTQMSLSQEALNDLNWWIENIESTEAIRSLRVINSKPNLSITSDASPSGWGAVCNGIRTGGHWTPQEAKSPINTLEILASFFGIEILHKELQENTCASVC